MGASPPLSRHFLLVGPKADVSVGSFYDGLQAEAMGDLGDDVLHNISLIEKLHTLCLQQAFSRLAYSH